MTEAVDATGDIEALAWQFLCSTYTDRLYWDWPLERRIDAFLRHQGRQDILNDGAAYGTLIDRVMENFPRARRDGKLHR